jgi:RNA polymerase sigma factor (sigma-70 family)
MENRIASVKDSSDPERNFFRFELRKAIDQLPPDQRRVIELLHLEGLPIEAKDPEALSVSKLLKCSDRTVRNRRDQAYAKLKEILGYDWSEL